MSGRCRLSCHSVEVRVSEVMEDQLYVDVVLGAGGEHLQLQLGGQVLCLVPGEEDHEVVRGAWCPVPRSSYCLSIMSDSLHQTTPDCFSISGGLGRTWASLGQSGTLRQHPVNTRTPTPSTPHSTSCVPSHHKYLTGAAVSWLSHPGCSESSSGATHQPAPCNVIRSSGHCITSSGHNIIKS